MCENTEGIIDTNLNLMPVDLAKRYLKCIKQLTKSGTYAWNENMTENNELYTLNWDEFQINAYLNYNAASDEAWLYVEDETQKIYYLFDDKSWKDDILDIYVNMVTYSEYDCWDKDTQLINDNKEFNFVEDVNYNAQILGEYEIVFKLDVNYNQEMLG